MTTKSITLDEFNTIKEDLKKLYTENNANKNSIKIKVECITQLLEKLDKAYLGISGDMNRIHVSRAIIIGSACRYIKFKLLHGQWMNWAEENLNESLRSLQKFMAISEATFVDDYSHLGIEKVYQLTRISSLAQRKKLRFEELFEWAGLIPELSGYSTKEFEKAVTLIFNKYHLEDLRVAVSNESLSAITGHFGLLKDRPEVISRFLEAVSEDANLEKVVQNVIQNNGQRKLKSNKVRKNQQNYDVNTAGKLFIEALQKAIGDDEMNKLIKVERIMLIGKLINEYMERLYSTT